MIVPSSDPLDAEGTADHHPLWVLVADDNAVVRASLRNLLRLCGCRVDEACDGRQALELASRNAYDVLLLDVQMPEMDGPQIARDLRVSLPAESRPRVVAMSAAAAAADRRWSLESGMTEFVQKPVRLDDLKRVLGLRVITGNNRRAPRGDSAGAEPDRLRSDRVVGASA